MNQPDEGGQLEDWGERGRSAGHWSPLREGGTVVELFEPDVTRQTSAPGSGALFARAEWLKMRIYEGIYGDWSLFSSLQLGTLAAGGAEPRNKRRSADCRALVGRPCRTTQIYAGTNQIQRMFIARKTFTGVR